MNNNQLIFITWPVEQVERLGISSQNVVLGDDDGIGDEDDRQASIMDNGSDDSDNEQMTFQNILAVLVGRQSLGGLR